MTRVSWVASIKHVEVVVIVVMIVMVVLVVIVWCVCVCAREVYPACDERMHVCVRGGRREDEIDERLWRSWGFVK